METAPWWASHAAGLAGVLLGGVIGLVGTLIATRRQVTHSERESRASVYAAFILAANEALDAASRFDKELEGTDLALHPLSRWRRDVLTGRKSPEQVQEEMDSVLERREDQSERVFSTHLKALRELHTRVLEVGLIGPPAMHEAAFDVSRALGMDEDSEERGAFDEALTDFMVIARDDLRAPNRPKAKAKARALPRQRRKAAAGQADGAES